MGDYDNTYEIGRRQKEMANDAQQSELFRALMGHKAAARQQQVVGQQAQDLAKYKDTLGAEGTHRNIATLEDLMSKHPGMGGSIGESGNVALTKPTPDPATSIANQNFKQRQVERLSGKVAKSAPLLNMASELEDSTATRDASGNITQGGILSDPTAKFKSYGKWANWVPDSAVGVAETLHLMPQGASAERANSRAFLNEYLHRVSGSRPNAAAVEREMAAHGLVGGGDPDVAAKSFRSRVADIKAGQQAEEAGFPKPVRETFHEDYKDPLANINIYNDSSAKKSLRDVVGGAPAAPQRGAPPLSDRQRLQAHRAQRGK